MSDVLVAFTSIDRYDIDVPSESQINLGLVDWKNRVNVNLKCRLLSLSLSIFRERTLLPVGLPFHASSLSALQPSPIHRVTDSGRANIIVSS